MDERFAYIRIMNQYLHGRDPKKGDVFRVTWIKSQTERRYVFYNIGNVTPVDPFNFKHINWLIAAEQTDMSEIPDEIKNYDEGR